VAWALAAGLLGLQWVLAVESLVAESPTVDEVAHLPAGVAYWQTGRFAMYHHNPPLVKLIAAAPVVASGVETRGLYESAYWREDPPNKAWFAHEFARLNAGRYFELFTRARLLMPTFGLVGGLFVFLWSRRLYDEAGGLLSLALWCACPNVLAHERLVTTDVPGASLMVGSTYLFWLYLKRPGWGRAALAGVALGLAQLTKFTALLLYGVWPLLWAIDWGLVTERGARLARLKRAVPHGLAIVALSILVIDLGYGFEGVGTPLGRLPFVSRSLTRERLRVPPVSAPFQLYRELRTIRENRFRGTWLEGLPAPLPREYLMGFDDQKFEAEGAPYRASDRAAPPGALSGYPVYLDGERRERSWWYYYLLAMAYKVPEGTWVLWGLAAIVLFASPRSRAPWADELAVLAVPAVVLFVMSVFTNINLGLRYVLPSFPFLFVATGKVARWAGGLAGRWRWAGGSLAGLALAATAASTLAIHPHYLAYFNLASGGPDRGARHLIDSNLDWGQDLIGLRRWLAEHAPGERVGLAYFGQVPPEIFRARGEGFEWFLPPARPGGWRGAPPYRYRGERARTPPTPGLYAVSASLVEGLPWRVYDSAFGAWNPWVPAEAGWDAFGYFRELEPFAKVGYSIFLYRVTPGQAARLARRWEGR
jgi:hypothetical protein